MTNEEILVELAILDSWQQQFPTKDKDVQTAQKLHREQLAMKTAVSGELTIGRIPHGKGERRIRLWRSSPYKQFQLLRYLNER
jgi:hypothetical protein